MATLRDIALDDAKEVVRYLERQEYNNAYTSAKATCELIMQLIEDEMYKGNNND